MNKGSTLIRVAWALIIVGGLLYLVSCSKEMADNPLANQTPKTYLWLFPDSSLGVGVSRQTLRWWGEDPDGVVIGFLFAYGIFPNHVTAIPNPDSLRYTWVTRNDTTILFPLDTLFRKFTVFVRSVDNTFRGLPRGSIIRFTPSPFWDKNENGVLDGNDEQLPDLHGAVDPAGAVQTFPVRNTRPRITFVNNPYDQSIPLKQPDTTFTVATFSWKGTDDDGNNTLSSYRIALNDTTNPARWVTISLRDTIVSLVVKRTASDTAGAEVAADLYGGKFLGRRLIGTIPGLRLDAFNTLYAQSRDVAGEYSPSIRMPSGNDRWYVRRPRGNVLIVSDYINSDSTDALLTYVNALRNIPGGQFTNVDQVNIGRGLTPLDKSNGKPGALVPPFIDPALIYTFLLYDYVIWYTDQYPSLGVAQLSLFPYTQNGGKVIFSTTFQSSVDPRGALRDFAPIDSISSAPFTPRPAPGDTRVPASYRVFPDSSIPTNIYPALAFNPPPPAFHSVFMRPIYRRADARYIYHLQADTSNTPPRYIGMPNVAVVDGQRTTVFIGLPLHLLNGTSNGRGLTAFFTKTLTQEFSPARHIDRRKF